MTVGDWLELRAGTAPAPLVAEVRRALADDLGAGVHQAPERCVAAAERVVARLIRDGGHGRESALALLAADALVTFAFEASADAPETVRQRAIAAMQSLGALA